MNITDVISTQRKGKCLIEAQSKLQALVKSCLLTGKAGRLVLVLKISPKSDGSLVVDDDVEIKPPKPEQSNTTFFADDQGALYREDPQQGQFAEVARVVNGKDE